jgi:hypothetical protein
MRGFFTSFKDKILCVATREKMYALVIRCFRPKGSMDPILGVKSVARLGGVLGVHGGDGFI